MIVGGTHGWDWLMLVDRGVEEGGGVKVKRCKVGVSKVLTRK